MKATAHIPVGVAATKSVIVTREMTVANFHSHMPEVFGTPMMIYLMEVAAADAIQAYLPEGWVSVGVGVNIQHLAATPIGFTVTAKATVVSVADDSVTFSVEAHDGIDPIGTGTHIRAPIEMARFLKKVKMKAEKNIGSDR